MHERRRAIEHLRSHLLRTSAPRLQMTLVLVLTAATGFATSALMLQFGITRMAVRYPTAVALAYFVFVLFLRLWLAWQRRRGRVDEPTLDIGSLDLPQSVFRGATKDADFGGGGGFGGGGAGGSWSSAPRPSPVAAVQSRPHAVGKGPAKGWDIDLDPGDGAIIIVPVAAVLVAVLASLYVIYAAPALFAELLLDGLVVTALYKRMKKVERRHWLRCVVRRTWVPAVLTAIIFGVAGHLMQRAVPGAPSIGAFWEAVTGSQHQGPSTRAWDQL
jgi:membrane protein implicated in regulation of membrane protease activity